MFDWESLKAQLNKTNQGFRSLKQLNISAHFPGYRQYEVIFENEVFLLRYYPVKQKRPKRVFLCVYSLINQVEILDFSRNNSLIYKLKNNKNAVFVIEWKKIKDKTIFHQLETYFIDSIHLAVTQINFLYQEKLIHLIGICQGGIFALCYASLFSEKLEKLILLMTPSDSDCLFENIKLTVKKLLLLYKDEKIISAEFIQLFFSCLNPGKHYLTQGLNLLDSQKNQKKYLKIINWLYNSQDLSKAFILQYLDEILIENKLFNGNLDIGKYRINLSHIKVPVLNVYAKYDRLVPVDSAKNLKDKIDQKYYQELALNSGHIGIFTENNMMNLLMEKI